MVGRSLTPLAGHNSRMRNRFRDGFGWLVWFCLLQVFDAAAWNAAGHRLTASLAWEQMNAESRQQATALLNQHIALPLWEKRLQRDKTSEASTPLARFAEASTWADDIRRLDNDAKQTDDRAVAVNRDWHYVNWPIGQGAAGQRGGGLDRAIDAQALRLADRRLPASERAQALAWLIHLVGDAHQPLHVASWPLPDGSFDDGGLGFRIRDEKRPRFPEASLHSWWDDLPGPPWLRGERLARQAERLRESYPAAKIVQGDSGDWIFESYLLAGDGLHPDVMTDQAPWLITESYRARARTISERRLAESGVRLGRLLNAILTTDRAITRARTSENAGRPAKAAPPGTRAPAGACCPAAATR